MLTIDELRREAEHWSIAAVRCKTLAVCFNDLLDVQDDEDAQIEIWYEILEALDGLEDSLDALEWNSRA